MSSVFYCLSQPPGHAANEIVDAISVSAVFDQKVAVGFIGEGVWQLFDQTSPSQGKNTTKMLSSLTTFDVEELLVERESLYQKDLFNRFHDLRRQDPQSLLNHVQIKDLSVIRARLHAFDFVITD